MAKNESKRKNKRKKKLGSKVNYALFGWPVQIEMEKWHKNYTNKKRNERRCGALCVVFFFVVVSFTLERAIDGCDGYVSKMWREK